MHARATAVEPGPEQTRVHPTAFVGEGVELGVGVTIGPGAVVLGPCRIEDGCWIGPHVVVGTPPEVSSAPHNAAWDGDLRHAGVTIGAGTVVRELSTIHQGTYRATTLGRGCWVLNRSYVAHDVLVGDAATLSAGTTLGGHVRIGSGANLGMSATVHQHRVVGPGAMVGMAAVVTRDVPPFALAYGSPARLAGVNRVGLTRSGRSEDVAAALQTALAEGVLGAATGLEDLAAEIEWWRRAAPAKPMTQSGAPHGD